MTVSRESSVRVGGLHIHVREVGEGPPLLLINGIGTHSAMWRPVEAALPGLRLIEFDAPGTGRSSNTSTFVTIPALAWLATRVLDEVGVERADVLGYSMGGIVAQAMAIYAPSRVRRLVLVSTTPGLGGVPGSLSAMVNVATPLRYYSERYYARTIGGMVGGRARTDRDWVARHGVLRRRDPPSLRGYLGQLAGIGSWTNLPLLHRIAPPTLVVTGDDDPLVPPANSVILARRIPRARLLVLPGEGHLLLMDARSTAPEPIRGFVTADSPEASSAWREGAEVTDRDVSAALAAAGRSMQPWGALGAVMRRAWPAAARPPAPFGSDAELGPEEEHLGDHAAA